MIYFGHNVTIILVFWQKYEILWEESKKLLLTLCLAFLCLSSSRHVIYGSNNERWTSVWFQLSTNFWQTRKSWSRRHWSCKTLHTERSTVEWLLANLICKTSCWDRYSHGTQNKMKWLPTVFDGTREAKFQINIIQLRTSWFLWQKSFFALYHKWIFWHTSPKNPYLTKINNIYSLFNAVQHSLENYLCPKYFLRTTILYSLLISVDEVVSFKMWHH